MGVLYTKLPDTIKKEVIDPYISIKNNEARISLRVLDSKDDLRRNELIKKINYDLENEIGLNPNEFKMAGVLILFNNLLQSLFKSQILTLGVVMAGITFMFLILFRNITFTLPIFGTSSARMTGKVAPPSVDIEIITSLSPIGFISVLATSHLIDSTAPPLTK